MLDIKTAREHQDLIDRLRHIKHTTRTHCVVCDSLLPFPLIELPAFPLTEIYTHKPVREKVGFVDQAFCLCLQCGHGQLKYIIDPQALYARMFYFRTSESRTAREASDYFLNFIRRTINGRKFRTILEVGCNDMYLLHLLKKQGRQLVGIDPVLGGIHNADPQIQRIVDFVENVDIKNRVDHPADLVISSHVMEHMEDPLGSLEQLLLQSSKDALFFFQFPGIESMIGDFRFDQIFHQHLSYFSLASTKYMLERFNCEMVDVKVNPYHWGALMVAFRRKKGVRKIPRAVKRSKDVAGLLKSLDIVPKYGLFQNSMKLVNQRLRALKNEKVYGYGAALMLPVLGYHLNNDFSSLQCVIDDDPKKSKMYYVNLPVKIRTLSQVKDIADKTVLVTATTALSNVRAILPKVIALRPRQIIVPLHIF